MDSKRIARIVAVVLFGALGALAFHLDHLTRGQMGRDAFLAQQAERFDRHFANPDSILSNFVVVTGMAAVLFGAYELVVLGVSRIAIKIRAARAANNRWSGP